MSQFAPNAFSDAEDSAPQAKSWRRVRAAVIFLTPGARAFKAIAFDLYDIAPEFPRLEAAMRDWRARTGAEVVDIEFEQSEDLAPTRDAFGAEQHLH